MTTAPADQANAPLARPSPTDAGHLSALVVVTAVAALAVGGLWSVPIVFLGAGAGAGHSLSGAV